MRDLKMGALNIRELMVDELESVAAGDYCPNPPCDAEEIKAGPVTVMKVPIYCNFWW